jgi:hypothetical protein
MTRPANTPKKLSAIALRVARSDDSGATLLMALIFVTVFSVVIATVLSFVDVNMRTTLAVRAEAAQAAAADGAAQIAINAMRQGTYTGTGNCFGANATQALAGFYQTTSGAKYSATVTCGLDTTDSAITSGVAINSGNKPGNAILTLGTDTSEVGLSLDAKGVNGTIKVHGNVFSNSTITADSLYSNAAVTARGDCSAVIIGNPKQCDIGSVTNSAGDDPAIAHPTAYAPPNQSTTVQTVPSCPTGTNPLVTFKPGLYNDVTALNGLTNGKNGSCLGGIFYFPPGTYYFDLDGSTPWTLGTGYLVGGKANLTAGSPPSIPGSCATPVPPDDPVLAGGWTNPGPGQGVEFVFGGASQLYLDQGQMGLCGSYSTTAPPIAIYGLKTAIGPVPAENGCITTIGKGGCSLISSNYHKTNKMFIQGTTYAPPAAIDIGLNNVSGQVFRYGIIARHLGITATASSDLGNPIIEVPDDAPGGAARTVVYLAVYVCPGTTACSTSGNPALKVKVGVYDPTTTPVAGARQVTVYNWSVQH